MGRDSHRDLLYSYGFKPTLVPYEIPVLVAYSVLFYHYCY